MKKLLILIVILFAFTGLANAGININTATQSELETLQGIGPAKAQAIIKHRKENGPFASKKDLVNVKGIGPGIIKQLHKDIVVKAKAVTQ